MAIVAAFLACYLVLLYHIQYARGLVRRIPGAGWCAVLEVY
jgi:hypothetical protein